MIDPRNLTLSEWADAVIQSLGSSWPFGTYRDGDDWRAYVVGFVRSPTLAERVLPDPWQFSDWRDWAERAAPMLEGAG